MILFGLSMTALWEPLEYLGEVLVFVGVVGEVVAERKLILKDDEEKRDAIEGISSWILVAGLAVSLSALIGTNEYFNGTIASLNLQAKQAGERAAQDELDAAQARTEADSFQGQIADSAARVKEAEAKVASAEVAQQKVEVELNKQKVMAATAEADLIKLQQRLSWRVIGTAQREKLVQLLRDSPTKGVIDIEFPGEDMEALHFANLIAGVLKDAGWPPIKGGEPQDMLNDRNTGLIVIGHKPGDTPAYARFLQRTFISGGLPCNGLYSENRAPGEVILSVGHRDTGP